jgi:hypothetical protein
MKTAKNLLLVCAVSVVAAFGCGKSKLSITAVEPNIGPTEGGHVGIIGTGFQDKGPIGVTVYFGDKKGKVIEVKDEKITARAPGGKAGDKVDIRLVFDDTREFVAKQAYEYQDVNQGFDVTSLTKK